MRMSFCNSTLLEKNIIIYLKSITLYLEKDRQTIFQRIRQRQGCEDKQALCLYTVGRRRRRKVLVFHVILLFIYLLQLGKVRPMETLQNWKIMNKIFKLLIIYTGIK